MNTTTLPMNKSLHTPAKVKFTGRTCLMEFERDDGSNVLIEYQLSPYDAGVIYGPAENCYPPEGGEIELSEATSDGVELIALTDAEWERAETQIYAQPLEQDYDGPEEWA